MNSFRPGVAAVTVRDNLPQLCGLDVDIPITTGGTMLAIGAQDRIAAVSKRDPRVDFLRGIALAMIFIDHIPGDILNNWTLRNLGFCDAAEIFVLLAGFASMSAYGKCFEREGARSGLRRVGLRCVRLWVFQVGLLVTTLAIRRLWSTHYGGGAEEIESLRQDGLARIVRAVTFARCSPV